LFHPEVEVEMPGGVEHGLAGVRRVAEQEFSQAHVLPEYAVDQLFDAGSEW